MRPKEEAQRYNFQRAPFCHATNQSKHDQGRRRKRRRKKSGATEINGLRKIRRSRTPTLEKASACFDVIKVDRSIGDCCMIPLVASATQNAASRFIPKMRLSIYTSPSEGGRDNRFMKKGWVKEPKGEGVGCLVWLHDVGGRWQGSLEFARDVCSTQLPDHRPGESRSSCDRS